MAKKPTPKVLSKKHLARLERERLQNRYIVVAAIVVIVLVFGLIGYGYLYQNFIQYNQAVAQVGPDSITLGQFQTEVRFNRWQLINQYNQTLQMMQLFGSDPSSPYAQQFQSSIQQITTQLNDANTMGTNVLDQMVTDRLIRQEAKKLGITVTKAEVDKALQDQFGFFPNGTNTPTVTATVWPTSTLSPSQTALFPPTSTPTMTLTPTNTVTVTPGGPTLTPAPSSTPTVVETPTATGPTAVPTGPTSTPLPTSTPMTTQAYQQKVNDLLTQLKPLNFKDSDIRYLIESSLYYQKVLDALTKDVPTSEDQVWARHILVADEATAKKVEDELKAGAKFADLAAKYSTDTSSKVNGGDVGWFAKGKMVKEFETAAFSMKIGEISQPIKSQFGYHIIQVLGHEVRPLSETDLQAAKTTKFQTWLDDQKKASTVKKFDTVWQNKVPTDPTTPPTTGQ